MKRFARFAVTIALSVLTLPALARADVKEGLTALDKQDYSKAAEHFAKAFEAGDGNGAFYLGRMFELGIGSQANPQAAIELYKKGADKASPAARNRLGMLYLEGSGVLQDYEEGAKLVCQAAETSDANGQFNCALVTMEGRGVPKDPAKAAAMLQAAVAQNHIGAKNILAQAYLTGQGVERDLKKAMELFQQTAAVGNPVGLFSLGQAYALGVGLDKDLVKAHAYFNLAAARQHPEALQARPLIEQQLKPEQVQEAQRFARAWRPQAEPTVTEKVSGTADDAKRATAPASAPAAKKK